jgi:hypothetical protein
LSDVRQRARRGSSSSVSPLWREKTTHEIGATDLVAAGQFLLFMTALTGSEAQQYLHRARIFQAAANDLPNTARFFLPGGLS